MWTKEFNIMMVWVVHVDDIMLLARMVPLCWRLAEMERRFGQIKRHHLRFTHMDMRCEQLRPGTRSSTRRASRTH
eukprot:5714441-Pyramimonas_sp.AAC.1